MIIPLVSDWVAVSFTYGLAGGMVGGLVAVIVARLLADTLN
jgi:hypothetical protein